MPQRTASTAAWIRFSLRLTFPCPRRFVWRRSRSEALSLVAVRRRQLRKIQTLFLDELDHLPVRDEITLSLGRIREEAAGDREVPLIASGCLLVNPGPADPVSRDEPDRGLDLRAGAISKPLEHAGLDLNRFVWVHVPHRHILLATPTNAVGDAGQRSPAPVLNSHSLS